VQNSYGGPEGLKVLVNECHGRGLAVVLDVVYNHLGPEGNYLWDFGPYFTDRYKTPWGSSINFDGPRSDDVRQFFIENALYWVTELHIDALRIDAVHAILDFSAQPFLEELASAVHDEAERLNRRVHLIAESALNDTRVIRSRELGGYGLDAQWNDDFHHALHTLLTGEREGYYQDFGSIGHLAKAFREGFIYSGEYSPYRRRRHGNSSRDIPTHQFVVFAQNHDQVGNRMRGERLAALVCLERTKLAAGIVLLSPFIPLMFMGEEYGETAPFPYFISHSDPDLIEAVRRGRRDEFAAFGWSDEPPDPQDEETFLRAKLNHSLRRKGHHRMLLELHRELLQLRKGIPALGRLSKDDMEVSDYERDNALTIRRCSGTDEAIAIFHFGKSPTSIRIPFPKGKWRKRLDSADERWHGPGSQLPTEITSKGKVSLSVEPHAFVLFVGEREF
jgi:maltooligosyltrehalose trehalohydrolase